MALKGAILVERGVLGRFTTWFFDSFSLTDTLLNIIYIV
jgi:hypothetical protein